MTEMTLGSMKDLKLERKRASTTEVMKGSKLESMKDSMSAKQRAWMKDLKLEW